jgi:hypothetical protein
MKKTLIEIFRETPPAKQFRMTRRTRSHVWMIPDHYGAYPPRGASHRVAMEDFREWWVALPKADGLDEQLFVRKSPHQKIHQHNISTSP